jgi:pectin methylesterase-like acyl-CoA thioesterase
MERATSRGKSKPSTIDCGQESDRWFSAVDFIFGMEASVWITGSTINTIGNGYITASGRQTADSNYYVIDKSSITGTGTQYLGRPWR